MHNFSCVRAAIDVERRTCDEIRVRAGEKCDRSRDFFRFTERPSAVPAFSIAAKYRCRWDQAAR
jgi:hypothetical protein